MKISADDVKNMIDTACVGVYQDGFRNHLGASQIGDMCKKSSWLTFRWAKKPSHPGRLYRLFNRGHMEEGRVVMWLREAGFEVMPTDVHGNQFKSSAVSGHFGGSCDGFVMIDGVKTLLEVKTSNDTLFKDLVKKGVKTAKPEHYQQMQTYMYLMQVSRALYIAVNKNNDDLHVEFVDANTSVGTDILAKAERIISSIEPMPQVSTNPSYYKCKMCDYHGICHKGEPAAKNCRSCKNARAIQDGGWACDIYNKQIPTEFIPIGCNNWHDITKP